MWSKVVVLLLALLAGGCATCATDLLLTPGKRAFNALKNRTVLPAQDDFDSRVTLAAMLAPGDDRQRWQQTRAAAIEGIVVRVHDANAESANCFSPTRLDAHIEVAEHIDATPAERVIVEITPPMRDWAKQAGHDWSTPSLAGALVGQQVRFEGWLLFDEEHEGEAENTRPGRRGNWRATAWEIHPVTAMTVINSRRPE